MKIQTSVATVLCSWLILQCNGRRKDINENEMPNHPPEPEVERSMTVEEAADQMRHPEKARRTGMKYDEGEQK